MHSPWLDFESIRAGVAPALLSASGFTWSVAPTTFQPVKNEPWQLPQTVAVVALSVIAGTASTLPRHLRFHVPAVPLLSVWQSAVQVSFPGVAE